MSSSLSLTPHERVRAQAITAELQRRYVGVKRYRLRPNQTAPEGDWRVWLLLAGRGFGKTLAGAHWIKARKRDTERIAIVAPTYADARDTCVEGDSGLRAICGSEIVKWNRSLGELEFDTGARVKLFSSDEPDRLRGPQHGAAWCDELGSFKYQQEAWDMLMFGLRHAPARVVVTTTPKPARLIRELAAAPSTTVTRGSTYDNRDNLAPAFFEQIVSRYEGTRLGRQELNAEILDDAAGALWKRDALEALRVPTAKHPVPDMARVVVGIDPSATAGGDEAGIVAAGVGQDGHGYVLDDASLRASPDTWAKAAVAAYHKHRADRLIAESNNGGEMVALTIQTVAGAPPVSLIHASRSKQARAEPVAALYEQGRVHHVGQFTQLEDELCGWEPGTGAPSPNRLDALVWALTELMLGGTTHTTDNVFYND